MSNTTNTTGASGDPLVYDPTKPVPYWHQDLELAFICIFNAMTLMLIVARVTIRRIRLKRFRKDDIWMMVAGGLLVFPYWVCQIGTNRYGSGLHVWNIPDSWHIPFFQFEWGWVGYYIASSMIKVSVCASLLEILPPQFVRFRVCVYALCGVICALGIAEACVWLFQCQPFLSNFIYSIDFTWCLDIDAARFAWVGISIVIDLFIVSIPFAIIRQIRLKAHERVVLIIVFGANLLGTLACAFAIYGIWYNSNSFAAADLSWTESIFIMTSDVEIFLYTLGASATMASRWFISKAEIMSNRSLSNSSPSWQRSISWPTSNESFHSAGGFQAPTPKPQPTKGVLPFNLKRGFKSPSVDILEGAIDLRDSPGARRPTVASYTTAGSSVSPRTPHPLLTNFDGQGGGASANSPSPKSGPMGLALNDVGGLMRNSTEKAPEANGARRSSERRRREHLDWEDEVAGMTPTDRSQPQPWEGRGPINGWDRP